MIPPLIVHDHEVWHRSAPPIAQPATQEPTPVSDSAPQSIAAPADIAARLGFINPTTGLTSFFGLLANGALGVSNFSAPSSSADAIATVS